MTLFDAIPLVVHSIVVPSRVPHSCTLSSNKLIFSFLEAFNVFLSFFLLSFSKIFLQALETWSFSSISTLLSTLFHCLRYMSSALQTLYNCILCALQVFLQPLPSINVICHNELPCSNLWDFALDFSVLGQYRG